jgi:two-component system phosphate regulon sensor histidine kinase PhoR
LRLGRNTYMIVIGIVAGSLLVTSLIRLQDSGVGLGWCSWSGVLCISAYFVGAMGVIWLCWFWVKLARAITSMAQSLKAEKPTFISPKANPLIDELSEAVNSRIESSSGLLEQLRGQVKDLQIQVQLSRRQKGNIEAIIYSLHDAVIVVDESDRLLMANEAAGKLFNFDFANSQYKPIDSLVVPDKREFVDFLRQSRQSKVEATRREIEFLQDERAKVYDCVISCVNDNKQQVCGVVAVLHDITKEKEIQRMKNDFVSHVSHELKTPLASIMAYSEMLNDGEADDEETRKEMYSVIQNQAKRLSRLIEDILNISRIESGLIKVEKKQVSLTMLIEEQLQMIKNYAEEKDIKIITQTPIIHDVVCADKDMISQVIVNLLSNAVKYTPRGGSVRIDIVVDETTSMAQVTVTDTGVGIPKDEIEHVFDKFYRVSANNKQAKGTGLGLNLVKQIIEKVHNGRVFVMSEPGVGSTFGFELPLAVSSEVEAAQ